MTTTAIILDQIRRLGWAVSVHHVNGTVEMHAVHLAGTKEPQVARCNDGDGPNEDYRCACLLASVLGVKLDDG